MPSSHYYDCSPENSQGNVIVSNDAKDIINNVKGLFTYILSISINILIIYFGISNFKSSKNANILVLLGIVFVLIFNIVFYSFGSIFKLFFYKIIGLSGILVSIIYGIIYIITNNVTLNVLLKNVNLDTNVIYTPIFVFIVFFIILLILFILVNIKGTTLYGKKNKKFAPTWLTLGIINDVILFFIIWIRLSDFNL